MAKLAVIIPAAGSGSRMGAATPKPFLELGNKPILWHTLTAFCAVNEVVQIIVPTSEDRMISVEKIFDSIDRDDVLLQTVKGGKERQFSIQNALDLVLDDVELVAVHDAVRPFISSNLITKTAKAAKKHGGAIVAVPAKDTIKKVDSEQIILETPDRQFLWQAQTPQIFQKNLLIDAYNSAIESKFLGTDDSSLVERIGGKVIMVEGDRENLKITYPVDLQIAELILKSGDRK